MVERPMKLVIFGQEGVGKTTFASLFPNPWFVDTEGSTKWIDDLQDRQYKPRPRTWTDIQSQISRFKEELPGDTLVIDTADWLESKFIDYLCSINGWSALGGQNDHGNSYNVLDKQFRKFLDELTEISEMGVIIVITAHVDTKTQTQPDEIGSWDRYQMKMQKKTSAALKEWADGVLFLKFKDVVMQIDKEGKKFKGSGGNLRVIKTEHSATWDAKNRWDLPSEMEFIDKQLPQPLIDLLKKCMGTAKPNVTVQTERPIDYSAPDPEPTPAPQPAPQPMPQPKTARQKLKELMNQSQIEPSEVEALVDSKGFFSGHLSIDEYPEDFIQQMLINSWEGFSKALFNMKHVDFTIGSIDSKDLTF